MKLMKLMKIIKTMKKIFFYCLTRVSTMSKIIITMRILPVLAGVLVLSRWCLFLSQSNFTSSWHWCIFLSQSNFTSSWRRSSWELLLPQARLQEQMQFFAGVWHHLLPPHLSLPHPLPVKRKAHHHVATTTTLALMLL
jgi:hypothetical protein